jgi:hypothetical protein
MSARWGLVLGLAVATLAGCKRGPGDASEGGGAPSGSTVATDAASGAPAPTSAASAQPISMPNPGPEAWEAAVDATIGPRPPRAQEGVSKPDLECATAIGDPYLEKKFEAAYDAAVAEHAKGEPERFAAWAKIYRPWYLRRETLLGPIAAGCDVSGDAAFAAGCAPFRGEFARLPTTKEFRCEAFAAWTREGKEGPTDTVACTVPRIPESLTWFQGVVLVDVPRSRRNPGFDEALRAAVEASGVASALGVKEVSDFATGKPSHRQPAALEVRTWRTLRRFSRDEGFLHRTLKELTSLGLSTSSAAGLLGFGDVWLVSVGTPEGAGVKLLAKGDTSDPLPPSAAPVEVEPCPTDRGRWEQAYCEVQRQPHFGVQRFRRKIPLSTAQGGMRIHALSATPDAAIARRRPIGGVIGEGELDELTGRERRPGRSARAQWFFDHVRELGGFEPILCQLDAAYRVGGDEEPPAPPRLPPGAAEYPEDRRLLAKRAGVGPADLATWHLVCTGDEKTSKERIVVHVPSHLVYARGSIPPSYGARGEVRIDEVVADPKAMFLGKLGELRAAEVPFVNLHRASKLRVSGYPKLWREGADWHVAFDPECPDEGYGCARNDGFEVGIELVEAEPCDVTGYRYP